MRTVFLLVTAAALCIAAVPALAQQRNYICALGGIEKCVAACNARGGQPRKCPGWCQQQSIQRCR